jgi:hypothetical protein
VCVGLLFLVASSTLITIPPLAETLAAATTHFSAMSHNHEVGGSDMDADKDKFEHRMCNLNMEEGGGATRSGTSRAVGLSTNAQLEHVKQWLHCSADTRIHHEVALGLSS